MAATELISVDIDKRQLRAVERLLRGTPKAVPKILISSINKTATKMRTRGSALIREKVVIKKKDIDKHLRIKRANRQDMSARIRLERSDRISLKYFGAKQVARGVTYRIEKGGRRKTILHAFGPRIGRLGGHVYVREGKSRLPIIRRHGPSPWGVVVKQDLYAQLEKEAAPILEKMIADRVRYELVRLAGKA